MSICRTECGACCIAPSISSALPGMPNGKPAGVACIHLTADFSCQIFDSSERPEVCERLQPTSEICGTNKSEAMVLIQRMELITAPDTTQAPVMLG